MHTTERVGASGRQRRRRHSAAFKAESIAACLQPGVSIAAVAMARSLNANLLRKWVVDAERQAPAAVIADPKPKGKPAPADATAFVPLALPPPAAPSSTSTSAPTNESTIRIKVRRGATVVTVEWPPAAARECGQWLRELLR